MGPLPVRLLASRRYGHPPDLELAGSLFLPAHTACTTPSGRAPGLVVGHGAGSRAANHEDFCLEACRHGFAVLALDFRGHGASEGLADGPLELDIAAAVDVLRAHPAVDPALVCYRGSSMGGFYGLKAAPLAAFAAMVLLCPAGEDVILDALDADAGAEIDGETEIDGKTEIKNKMEIDGVDSTTGRRPLVHAARWDRARLRSYFQRQDSRRLAAHVDCPVLLVHARQDRQVPFEHSLLLARHLRADTTLLALEIGGHTTAQHSAPIHAYTLSWLRDRVVGACDRCEQDDAQRRTETPDAMRTAADRRPRH